jgi:hypothetical protein
MSKKKADTSLDTEETAKLRDLKAIYGMICKKYGTSPLPSVTRKIDECISSGSSYSSVRQSVLILFRLS